MNKLLLVYLILLIFSFKQSHAQITSDDFSNRVNYTTLKYPVAVRTADLNADGKPDLIVANEGGILLSVFKNTAVTGRIDAASFAARQDFDIGAGVGPESLAVADIDGDGKPDIVASNYNDQTVAVLRNTSSGGTISFAGKVNVNIGFSAHAISLGDIDGDGKTDLAVTNNDASSITLFRNTSVSGTVTLTKSYDIVCGNKPGNVAIADVSGDAKPELIVVLNNTGQVMFYKNKAVSGTISAASFEVPINIGVNGSKPGALTVADVNADGKADVLVSNLSGDAKVMVLNNTTLSGAISFTQTTVPATKNPYDIAVKDIDNDGKPDMIVTSWNATGLVSVFRNLTAGAGQTPSFDARVDFSAGTNPQDLAVDDLDGDGKQDLAVVNSMDNTVSVLRYNPANGAQSVFPESTATQSIGSFVSTDILDPEWALEAPPTYNLVPDNGVVINPSGTALTNAGKFVYFRADGTAPNSVPGNLTFSAKGTGTLEVRLIAAYDNHTVSSTTFALSATQFQDFNWTMAYLYPNTEYILAFLFNGTTSAQSVTFKKNICLNLRQVGLRDNFMRFRADNTTLIGNIETGWYGWSDQANLPKKKYLQHSAYARMRFQTDATKIVLEYVRDFYDSRIINLFPLSEKQNGKDWDASGNVINGNHVVNTTTKVTGGKTYTISGLTTTTPSYVWFSNGAPLGPAQNLSNVGTAQNPVYQLTAPASATRLGLLVQRITNTSNFYDPVNDTYLTYVNCQVQEGAVGSPTTYDGNVPTPYRAFAGYTPARISGPAIFVNGKLYKYYQVEGNDIAKVISFLSDDLPAGMKTVEVMMPGQGTLPGYDPKIRRSGTFLRAVYFPSSNTTVSPATTVGANSIAYIHDSILSGYNISTSAQSNVWMMKVKYDPSYGGVLTGDIFSEGYAGRILHTNTSSAADITAFAQKLAAFNVNKYWFQIGVNDYGFNTPLHLYYNELTSLVEQLRGLRTSANMYIQGIGPDVYEGPNSETYADDGLSTTGPTADDYRDVQRAVATTHSYCEYVNFEDLFPSSIENLPDGIHPSDAGNALYADGIRNNSTLLGNTPTASSLDFYRPTIRSFVNGVPSISVFTAKGGSPPYTFTKLSGTLPGGLTFNANGTITGTPTAAGSVSLSVKVTDAAAAQVTKSFTLTVNPNNRIFVSPSQIIGGVKNTAYYKKFRGVLGYGKYSVARTAGTLPAGMNFDPATGILSGTPTVTGTFNFTLTATDHWGFTGSSSYTFNVGTGTPAALSDHFYPTAVMSGNNIMVTGHLHDLYNGDLYTYIYAYATQGGVERAIGGANVNVLANNIDGAVVNIGAVNPSYGPVISLRLANLGVNPSSLDGINIAYDANTNVQIAIP